MPPGTARSSRSERPQRSPVLRFLVLLGLLAAALVGLWALGLTEPETLQRILDAIASARGSWWAPLVLIGLYLLFCPLGLPISPLVATGGAVFGLLGGWTINMLGACAGALLGFELGRAFGRGLVERLAGPERTDALAAVLERHGFWTLVRVRFLPIPFGAVNYAAALIGVHRGPFLASTALGLVLPMLVYTQLGSVLVNAAAGERAAALRQAVWLLLLFFLLTFAPVLWRRLRGGGKSAVESQEGEPAEDGGEPEDDSRGPASEEGGAEAEAGRQQRAGADEPETESPGQ